MAGGRLAWEKGGQGAGDVTDRRKSHRDLRPECSSSQQSPVLGGPAALQILGGARLRVEACCPADVAGARPRVGACCPADWGKDAGHGSRLVMWGGSDVTKGIHYVLKYKILSSPYFKMHSFHWHNYRVRPHARGTGGVSHQP